MSDETTNTESTPEIKTEGTVRHNKELLDELKQARASLAAFEAEKAEREADNAKKRGDYESLLKKEQDKAAKALAERDANLTARDAKINQLLTDNALKDMIGAYDVKPSLRPALVALLKGQLSVTEDGVMFDDKSPADFGKAFFASEEGRDFLKPALNSGGGATGNAPSTQT
jgi:hypothetical protein